MMRADALVSEHKWPLESQQSQESQSLTTQRRDVELVRRLVGDLGEEMIEMSGK